VRPGEDNVLVRDSKSRHTGTLTLDPATWRALLTTLR
jgi:hypothetical protein